MNNKLKEFKAAWTELFTEKKDKALKNTVFRLLGDLEEVNEQLANLAIQEKLFKEKKDKVTAEIAELE